MTNEAENSCRHYSQLSSQLILLSIYLVDRPTGRVVRAYIRYP